MKPHLIHQIWINDNDIPYERYKKHWIDSWKLHNPSCKHIIWYKNDVYKLIKSDYEWFYTCFCELPSETARADCFRCILMHKFGGLYADLDSVCMQPLDHLFVSSNEIDGVYNNLLVAIPGHSFFIDFLRHHVLKFSQTPLKNKILKFTGPLGMATYAKSLPHNPINRLPQHLYERLKPRQIKGVNENNAKHMFVLHQFAGSWKYFKDA